MSVDTDLMVGIRLVGFDSDDGIPLTDLVEVDEVVFVTKGMPDNLRELIPEGFRVIE